MHVVANVKKNKTISSCKRLERYVIVKGAGGGEYVYLLHPSKSVFALQLLLFGTLTAAAVEDNPRSKACGKMTLLYVWRVALRS